MLWESAGLWLPTSVKIDGDRLYPFPSPRESDPAEWQGLGTLLRNFLLLADVGPPDEVVTFMTGWGVPDLCTHGYAGFHGGRWCRFAEDERGVVHVSAQAIRMFARAFVAARTLSEALAARRPTEARDWAALYWVQDSFPAGSPLAGDDWRRGRLALAQWVEQLLRDAGVRPSVRWSDGKFELDYVTPGLVGMLAVLLGRDLQIRLNGGRLFACSSCGRDVTPARTPRPGEAVYCGQPECKREQQRRNQARRRARQQGS